MIFKLQALRNYKKSAKPSSFLLVTSTLSFTSRGNAQRPLGAYGQRRRRTALFRIARNKIFTSTAAAGTGAAGARPGTVGGVNKCDHFLSGLRVRFRKAKTINQCAPPARRRPPAALLFGGTRGPARALTNRRGRRLHDDISSKFLYSPRRNLSSFYYLPAAIRRPPLTLCDSERRAKACVDVYFYL
ncbi:hypothetical protein EVAR_63189_1 [Eumeta japonica]|uniref:Uncharacterized protein n=1 Tax=Eumeta variegata TaxID=151549 RepID=A0A4C1ZZN5_EUMVA|nr:hypothetical protein EVAR_63189_1 [Eumeta japonica]